MFVFVSNFVSWRNLTENYRTWLAEVPPFLYCKNSSRNAYKALGISVPGHASRASRALVLTSLETLHALVLKRSESVCVDLRAEQNTEHEKQSSATARIHLIHNVLSGEKLEEKPLILRRSIILIKTLRHSRILLGLWLFLKSDRSHSRELSYDNHRIALTSLLIESDGLL